MKILESTTQEAQAFGSKMLALACDLDTTLAPSKQPLEPDMAQLLCAFTAAMPIAVISGGAFHLFESQLLPLIPESADKTRIHLLPTSGARRYAYDPISKAWQLAESHDLSVADREAAISALTYHAHALGLWLPDEQVKGERIEDRGGQITFSALGQLASRQEREAWDPDRVHKNALAAAVAQDLPHLTVKTGGSTSVDVIAPGIDKGFAVQHLAQLWDIPIERIAFIGDRMEPDGNDYPAAAAGAFAVHVHQPADTKQLLNIWVQHVERNALG